mgnify:CR=1 FL=1
MVYYPSQGGNFMKTKICNIKVEYFSEPIGLNAKFPHYSWEFLCDADNVLIGNMTITGNKLYGFGDIFADFKMGENNPVYADGFYTPDVNGTLGQWTTDMGEATTDAELIIFALPSPLVRTVAKDLSEYVSKGQIIVNLSKGLEKGSLKRLSEVLSEEIPQGRIVVMSGPSHAEEVSRDIPTTVVVSSEDIHIAEIVQDIFMSPKFRVYTNPDVVGVELGGALKNIIAFGAGICDGLGYGDNAKAALMTRGIKEIGRLGVAMGAKASTFSGLSGIGDLIVTCTSMHSRNRRAGILIGEGKTMDEAMTAVNQVVEGVYSAKAAILLAEKYNVSMPIVKDVSGALSGLSPHILYHGCPIILPSKS